MIQKYDLARLKWQLGGWEPQAWRQNRGMHHQSVPEIGPHPAPVPGSVQTALLNAGRIPDWTEGLNSYACEWIENRHWEYAAKLPAKWFPEKCGAVRLRCLGLDHSGSLLLNGNIIATFEGTLIPHTFDLTDHILPGQDNHLSFLFEGAPDEQNQYGWSSRSKHLKPRFHYKWDWCPRIVTLGIWDNIWVEVGDAPRLDNVRPRPRLDRDLKAGRLEVHCRIWSNQDKRMLVKARVKDGEEVIAETTKVWHSEIGPTDKRIPFPKLNIEPWQPNGQGKQKLYDLEIEVVAGHEEYIDTWTGKIGFKNQRWVPCEGAPASAREWICEVNGQKVFLQGANWVPIRANYQDLTRADYAKRIKLYKKLGFNLLRVWGGGLIEKRDFYELCDENGILVWQEFPLSSSGLENAPPRDPVVIEKLVEVARSAIERRAGHVSLLQWCGGNELSEPSTQYKGHLAPVDETHPCIRALADITHILDPDHRFLPTSPQGPVFWTDPARFGEGIHHNVHGPWRLDGTLEEWKAYWDQDDALFRGEFGCPGASPMDILEAKAGDQDLWPPKEENPFWRSRGQWWVDWNRFGDQLPKKGGKAGVEKYVELSQQLQAEALEYAVSKCKARFPRMGGVIIWMGHDAFPCAANTAIIDYEGRPKPAAEAVGKVFRRKTG